MAPLSLILNSITVQVLVRAYSTYMMCSGAWDKTIRGKMDGTFRSLLLVRVYVSGNTIAKGSGHESCKELWSMSSLR